MIVQKYLHDLAGWNALPTEAQERIIGRSKLSDIELDDAVKPTSAHNALTTIVEDGKEIKILRDNMPFGRASQGEFGTYFIGYSRSPRDHRTDARQHVRRHAARQLRPAAGFQPRGHRQSVLRAVRTFLDSITEEPASARSVAGRSAHPPRRNPKVRWASDPSKEKSDMNNLHRELAPISDMAWAEIEEEASRTLKRYLAGRRVVDVQGPGGSALSAVGTGHLRNIARRGTASSPASAKSSLWWNCAFPSS